MYNIIITCVIVELFNLEKVHHNWLKQLLLGAVISRRETEQNEMQCH